MIRTGATRASGRKPSIRRWLAAVPGAGLAAALFLAGPVSGQSNVTQPVKGTLPLEDPRIKSIHDKRDARYKELTDIEEALSLSSAEQERIEKSIAGIRESRETLNAALLAAAKSAQDLEAGLTEAEERLSELATDEAVAELALQTRRRTIAGVLAALQRLRTTPPPPLVVQAGDALASVRSAMMLSSVLPELKTEADALAGELARWTAIRTAIETERKGLVENATRFSEEKKRIEILIAKRNAAEADANRRLGDTRARAEKLARDAGSLRDLIAVMDEELRGEIDAANARAAEEAKSQQSDGRSRRQNTARLTPAVPFSEARNSLSLPVRGAILTRFGDDDGLNGVSKGLSVATRSGAQVTSPSDGWVLYAGTFRSFGQLLIIDAGDDYHIVMAGLGRADVEQGQFVLAGEPVGIMGERRLASLGTANLSSAQPTLYVEFRKNGQPVDSGPWWAGNVTSGEGS